MEPANGNHFDVGPWRVDPVARTVRTGPVSRALRSNAMLALCRLAAQPGEVVPLPDLQLHLGGKEPASANVVRKAIAELRLTLALPGPQDVTIESVARRGYRLLLPANQAQAPSPRARARTCRPAPPRTIVAAFATALLLLPMFGHYILNTKPGTADEARAAMAARHPQSRRERTSTGTGRGHSHELHTLAFARLQTLAGDSRGRDFADALTTRIARALAGISPETTLKTLQDDGARNGRGQQSPRAMAIASGATHVLHGAVHHDGDAWQVTLALDDVRTNSPVHVFEERADPRDLRGEERIATHVANGLRVLLDARKLKQMRQLGTTSVDAYGAYQEACYMRFPTTTQSLLRAQTLFQRAFALDPEFAGAMEGEVQALAVAGALTVHAQTRADLAERSMELRAHIERYAPTSTMAREVAATRTLLLDASPRLRERSLRADILLNARAVGNCRCYLAYADLLIGAGLYVQADAFVRAHRQYQDRGWDHDRRALIELIRDGPHARMSLVRKKFRNNAALMAIAAALLAYTGDSEGASRFAATLHQTDTEGFWAAAAVAHMQALDRMPGDAVAMPARTQGSPSLLPWFAGTSHLMQGNVNAGIREWKDMSATEVTMASLYQSLYELTFPPGVLQDARYQAALEDLGIGRSWKAALRRHVAELAPVTGIDPS